MIDFKQSVDLVVKSQGSMTVENNAEEFKLAVINFTSQLKAEDINTDKDVEVSTVFVKKVKEQRDNIKLAISSLDSGNIADIKQILKESDSILQKCQSSLEKANKDFKQNQKETFYNNAYEEVISCEKFGIPEYEFRKELEVRVKGMRSLDSMSKVASEYIEETNKNITELNLSFNGLSEFITEYYAKNGEVIDGRSLYLKCMEFTTKKLSFDTAELYLEKDINSIKEAKRKQEELLLEKAKLEDVKKITEPSVEQPKEDSLNTHYISFTVDSKLDKLTLLSSFERLFNSKNIKFSNLK